MTRKEAIKHLRNDWFMSLGGQLCVDEDKKDAFLEAIGMGIKALRPISREQVEKVWRGCEKCSGAGEYSRYAENLTKILLAKYCPHCGRPLTDEAVDMMLERWKEAVEGV